MALLFQLPQLPGYLGEFWEASFASQREKEPSRDFQVRADLDTLGEWTGHPTSWYQKEYSPGAIHMEPDLCINFYTMVVFLSNN